MSCLGNSDYDIVWCFFHLYIPIRRIEPPPTGSKPPDSLHVEHKAFHINIFKGCIHIFSSYLNRSRDCRHGGVLKIFALGSTTEFLSGSYQSGTLSAAYDAFLRKMRDSGGVLDSISLVLALILFRAKIVESLLQRQWYLGGQQIGIRVRVALMILDYMKPPSIKDAGSN